jgi:hypothetical protein
MGCTNSGSPMQTDLQTEFGQLGPQRAEGPYTDVLRKL